MFRTAVIRDLLPLARKLGPPKFRRFLANISPFSLPKDFLDVTDTLEEASKMVLSKKREALEKGEDAINELAGKGKDIISVLCEIFYICLVTTFLELKLDFSESQHERGHLRGRACGTYDVR